MKSSNDERSEPARAEHPWGGHRAVLLAVSIILLGFLAIFVGMVGEWMESDPARPMVVGVLAFASLGGALAIGFGFTKRKHARSRENTDARFSEEEEKGDSRPVLVFIWWPITIVAVGVALLTVFIVMAFGAREGAGLPAGIVFVVGVFGFIILPTVVRDSVVQFRGRGVRGFWRAFRRTEWGEGMP